MYATRLGTGSGVEPQEGRRRPAGRRVDYSIMRAPRVPNAAAAEHRPASSARPESAARAARLSLPPEL
jgi:hypothetical protein